MDCVGPPWGPVRWLQDGDLAMNEEELSEPPGSAWSPKDHRTSPGSHPPSPPHPAPARDSLLALGHLQEVEVDSALHVGMEGKEATQEVIPRQAEVRVLSQHSQDLEQNEQGADRPGLRSHGWEVGSPEVALPHQSAGRWTPRNLHRRLHSDGPATVRGGDSTGARRRGQRAPTGGEEAGTGGWNAEDPLLETVGPGWSGRTAFGGRGSMSCQLGPGFLPRG